jgi:hypothetical protein
MSWPRVLKQLPLVLLRKQQIPSTEAEEPAAMQLDAQDSQDAVVSCCWLANSASTSIPTEQRMSIRPAHQQCKVQQLHVLKVYCLLDSTVVL